jgi:hypothetical protein
METHMPFARPYTPPETEAGTSPPSEFLSDPFKSHSSDSADADAHWLPPATPTKSARRDTPLEPLVGLPHLASTISEPAPYTPTKTFSLDDHAHGALRYPYTPESSRILRASTTGSLSPIPWDNESNHSASPVQSALSSCIAHFQNFILTRQPTDDQLEYIVGQFEAMTTYLSVPESQTKSTAEYLFSDIDNLASGTPNMQQDPDIVNANAEYFAQVGTYIEGVTKYTEDLKMRLEEVKTLNRAQLAVIDDLKSKVESAHSVTDDASKNEDSVPAEQPDSKVQPTPAMTDSSTQTTLTRTVRVQRTPARRGFWASLNDALDAFGDDLLDG